MPEFASPLDVYKVLPKTNCRDCGLPTCLAFAVHLLKGQKPAQACPHLDDETLAELPAGQVQEETPQNEIAAALDGLRERVCALDLSAAAERLGLAMKDGRVVIPVLGKEFGVGPDGIVSACHVNAWLTLPLLQYVSQGAGRQPTGRWLPLRDLPGGADWRLFFEHRCEKPLKKVIDEHTSLFEMLIEVFSARPAPREFDSDIAVVLHPLPQVPMLLCYWPPEDGMESSLHVFFDETAADNLGVEPLYYLGTGLVTMFGKIARTHGV
ncbi:MAG: DUF3786 domain-containing protein [Deltaproteobacteria bacterium]|nr:DUF3786 domain-containing protein [Deltaproteobacteria bacterium]